MQHDHVLKKLNFNLLIPRVAVEGEGPLGSAFPFNLICNMTMFLKKLHSDRLKPPRVRGGGGLRVKYLHLCCCIRDSI